MLSPEKQFNGHSGAVPKSLFSSLHIFIYLHVNSMEISILSSGASGIGAGMDIVVSSVKAYVGALNKMLGFKESSPTKVPVERTTVSA